MPDGTFEAAAEAGAFKAGGGRAEREKGEVKAVAIVDVPREGKGRSAGLNAAKPTLSCC